MTPEQVRAQPRSGDRERTRRLATAGGVLAWIGAVLPVALSHRRDQVPPAWWVCAVVALASFVLLSAGRIAERHGPRRWVLVGLSVASGLAACTLWGIDQTSPVLLVLTAGAAAWVLSRRTIVLLVSGLAVALVALMAWLEATIVWALIYMSLMGFAALMIQVVIREGQAVDEADRMTRELAAANALLRRTNEELEAAQARLAEASRAEERLRISRNLHDGMGNQLTALSLTLDLLGRRTTDEAARRQIDEAKGLAAGLLRDTRSVVSHLRDQRISVRDEIARLARSLPRPRTSLDLAEDLDTVPGPVGEAIVRVVQESLTNVARHSPAERAWVRVSRDDEQVTVQISDDGPGADAVRAGNGLSGMSERVALLGGRLSWTTTPGAGFRVSGTIPAPRESDAAGTATSPSSAG